MTELLRGRLSITGPATASSLAAQVGVAAIEVDEALLALEGQGAILRGRFTDASALEFCDRVLLARVHRYTLDRLRAEIEPVSAAEFMRFLLLWQHVDPNSRLAGDEGLRAVIAQLDGLELSARAWERVVLPARVDQYEPRLLDLLCLTGQVGWSRLSVPPGDGKTLNSLRVALFLAEHADGWQALRGQESAITEASARLDDPSRLVLETLRSRGASFVRDLVRICGMTEQTIGAAMASLAVRGLATSDGFAGVRDSVRSMTGRAGTEPQRDRTGRWSAVRPTNDPAIREAAVETQARVLLQRYGVMFGRLLARETNPSSWRELTRVYRRLEARGEIRGGRFVAGFSGEQFALPEAVAQLRELRRTGKDGRVLTISAADPLNLTGILTSGDRIRAVSRSRVAYRDGIALAVLEGDFVRPLTDVEPAAAAAVTSALVGRQLPAITSGFVGR